MKAHGTKRLTLKYNELLSSFAFKFNLRRFTKGARILADWPTMFGKFWQLVPPSEANTPEAAEVDAAADAAIAKAVGA